MEKEIPESVKMQQRTRYREIRGTRPKRASLEVE